MNSKHNNGERQSDLAVMSVDEYKQKRKLERILDNMHAIGDKSRESWNEYVNGEIDDHGKNVTIQQNVKEAIRECDTMLRLHAEETEGADYYWEGYDTDPIGEIPQYWRDNILIVGLRDFVEFDAAVWVEEWEEKVKPRNQAQKTVQRQIKHSVPESVSRNAASRLGMYLSRERGIELTTEQKEIEVHADPW